VLGLEKKIPVKQVVKDLIAEDGWKGVYRGLGPRLFSTSAWGTSMILAYEYLSKNLLSDFIVLIILFVYTGLVYLNIEITM